MNEKFRMTNDIAEDTRNVYKICEEFLRNYKGKEIEYDQYNETERKFYIVISDFFLQQKQKEVIEKGIF